MTLEPNYVGYPDLNWGDKFEKVEKFIRQKIFFQILIMTETLQHTFEKSLPVDTINTLSDHRNVNFNWNRNYAKIERKLIRFRKKNLVFQII